MENLVIRLEAVAVPGDDRREGIGAEAVRLTFKESLQQRIVFSG
jgi:hypothetical protein